jgi:Secretion system C-terminal sorting domain
MKRSLLLSALGLIGLTASAQMPNNSICPDFTGTDLQGNVHNLYDYLDQGYTVVVDVSATWCGPCWNYHNGGALETLYEQHGPPSADPKVIVLFIEGDGSTTLADLNGTGSNTQGNWVSGTGYPIIDNASIANLLEIGYFPTLYKICPNRVITEVGQVSASAWWTACQACPVADTPTDAMVLPNLSNPATCAGNPVDLKVRMQNVGTTPLTSATIEARQGATVLGSTDWTGSLDTYGWEEVDVTSVTPTGNMNISYVITTTDDDATNNSTSGTVTAANTIAPGISVSLELRTDGYGSEITWKLFNPDGSVFDQDPAGNYGNNTTYTENWTLENESCYRFEIYDSYGDGILNPGFYKLKVGTTVFEQGGGTSGYDEFEISPFTTDWLAGIEVIDNTTNLNIYPNPTNDGMIKLEFGRAVQATVDVFNVLGVRVMSETFNTTGVRDMDLRNLTNGVYYLTINSNGKATTRKVTVNK